jgi:excisionase family DNA binding protein
MVAQPRQATAPTTDDVLDIKEACALLKVSRNVLYDACARAKVPHQRIGRQIRFSRQALVRWLGSCSSNAAPEGA